MKRKARRKVANVSPVKKVGARAPGKRPVPRRGPPKKAARVRRGPATPIPAAKPRSRARRGLLDFTKKAAVSAEQIYHATSEAVQREIGTYGPTDYPEEKFTDAVFQQLARGLRQAVPGVDWVALELELEARLEARSPTFYLAIRPGVRLSFPNAQAAVVHVYPKVKRTLAPVFDRIRPSNPLDPVVPVVAMPLLVGGQLQGALVLGSGEPRRLFEKKDALLARPYLALLLNFWLERQHQVGSERARFTARAIHDQRIILAALKMKLEGIPVPPMRAIAGVPPVEVEPTTLGGKMLRRSLGELALTAKVLGGQQPAAQSQTFDLNQFLAEVKELCDASWPASRVELTIESRLEDRVNCDPGLILGVLMNLIMNSWQSFENQPHKGRIQIRLSQPHPAADTGPLYALIEIEDNGPGLDKEQAEAYRAGTLRSPKTGAAGLGLRSIFQALALHQLPPPEVQSRLEEGTTVSIRLPRIKTIKKEPPKTAETAVTPPPGEAAAQPL